MVYDQFQKEVLSEGKLHYRDMPWRRTRDPYCILVSEVMLQQTQVDRVVGYFEKFMKIFPRVEVLASASLFDVLSLWNGLGYNRRAKWLHGAAQKIVREYSGAVPDNIEELTSLHGIGHNTAAAICVYGFNKPEVFIETNIRTVYIYHFFSDYAGVVPDKELKPILEATLYKKDARRWYWALMDYGTHLKKSHGNLSRKSSAYRKQSSFEGSQRQLRGKILKMFLITPYLSSFEVENLLRDKKFKSAFEGLLNEGFLTKDKKGYYQLTS